MLPLACCMAYVACCMLPVACCLLHRVAVTGASRAHGRRCDRVHGWRAGARRRRAPRAVCSLRHLSQRSASPRSVQPSAIASALSRCAHRAAAVPAVPERRRAIRAACVRARARPGARRHRHGPWAGVWLCALVNARWAATLAAEPRSACREDERRCCCALKGMRHTATHGSTTRSRSRSLSRRAAPRRMHVCVCARALLRSWLHTVSMFALT